MDYGDCLDGLCREGGWGGDYEGVNERVCWRGEEEVEMLGRGKGEGLAGFYEEQSRERDLWFFRGVVLFRWICLGLAIRGFCCGA